MRTNNRRVEINGASAVLLYRLVFRSKGIMLGVVVLLFSILLQPIDFVYADELAVEETEVEEVVTEEIQPEDEVELETETDEEAEVDEEEVEEEEAVESEPEVEETESAPGDTEVASVSNETDQNETLNPESTVEEDGESEQDLRIDSDDEQTVETATTTTLAEDVAATTTPDSAEESATSTEATATSTDITTDVPNDNSGGGSGSGGESDEVDNDTAQAVGTSTINTTDDMSDSASSTEDETNSETEDEGDFSPFDDDSESEAGEQNSSPEANSSESTEEVSTSTESQSGEDATAQNVVVQYVYTTSDYQFTDTECVAVGDGSFYCTEQSSLSSLALADDVFAAPDADGDMEIFVRLAGEEVQVTDNLVDDAAPDYDAVSNTMVWHRSINDRFQIILYDYKRGEEKVLTSGNKNHMEPSVFDEYVVWQEWVNDNWEIALYDGDGIRYLSDNDIPDVAPNINEQYVIWNTVGAGGERMAKVYDITTGATEVIDDYDGGAVKNPRFVLVYDTEYENGDVITRGYDPKNGTIQSLGTLPADMPDEIPPVDQTGETRALIQNKSSNGRDDVVEDTDLVASPSASGSTTLSISIPVATTTDGASEPTEIIVPEFVATSTDDVLEEVTQASTTVIGVNDIEDVVIPPRTASSTKEAG